MRPYEVPTSSLYDSFLPGLAGISFKPGFVLDCYCYCYIQYLQYFEVDTLHPSLHSYSRSRIFIRLFITIPPSFHVSSTPIQQINTIVLPGLPGRELYNTYTHSYHVVTPNNYSTSGQLIGRAVRVSCTCQHTAHA